MNRLYTCIILLCFNGLVSAETLYQWTEADGSITFSPTKPPAGVAFKTIESAGSGKAEVKAASNGSGTSSNGGSTQAAQVLTTASVNAGSTNNPKTNTGNSQNNAAVRSNQKQGQCIELSKRVVSLERRLRSPLKPIDMDNTVVAMARYQRSYDQYCVE